MPVRRPAAPSAIAVIIAATLALGGCSGRSDTASAPAVPSHDRPAYGDTFIDALLGDVSGLIPNILSDAPSFEVGGMLYNGLITRDRDLNPIGDLAESWTFSADCLDLTFKLRPNVRWHDGTPFTADDVLFTYQTMMNPKTPTPYRDEFSAVERVEAEGPLTVHVRYRMPYAKALTTWEMWMLPKHVLEPWVASGKLREAPQNWNAPVGTGPYRFDERRAGEKLVLLANRDYFAGRPYLSRVVYRIIPSQATMFLELKAKGVDADSALTALQYTRQTNYPAFRKAYQKYRYASNAYTYVGFNHRDPRFADRRVRQAIAYAIDKRELIDGVVLGLGRDATGPYKPGTWPYNGNVKRYPHDAERARRLLAEAGWKNRDTDGVLMKDGKRFEFELLTNQGNDERKKIAEIVQASLKDVGIAVDIRILEWSTLLKEYVRKRRFEALILGWGIGVDPDQYLIWHTAKDDHSLNTISYSNPEVDELLERGRSTCSQPDRVKYYYRIQEILAEDAPVVFLYFRDALAAVSSRVHGIDPGASGLRYNFPEWYVPKELQRYTSG